MAIGKLVLCVIGVYTCFLTWGVLQERLSTTVYSADGGRFIYFKFLNCCVSLSASCIAFLALKVTRQGHGLTKPSIMLRSFMVIAFFLSIGAPLGYEALKHINYPTMILAKSCKLLPVMLMNFVVNRHIPPPYKFLCVFLITAGVAGFMYFDAKNLAKSKSTLASNSVYGLALLLANLLIDGMTNSLQDKAFAKYTSLKPFHMMLWVNVCTSFWVFGYISSPYSNELYSAPVFLLKHPHAVYDLGVMCICNALGQIFIFLLLQEYGSLTLVTVTITRKLFTVLLSLFIYSHAVNRLQWVSVALVFTGIFLESYFKMKSRRPTRVVEFKED